MIDRIAIRPLPARDQYRAELHGQLAAILALAHPESRAGPKGLVLMVAEEGLEPPTRGL